MSAPIEPSSSMIRRERISSSWFLVLVYPLVAIGNQSPDRKVTRHSRAAKTGKTGE